MTLHNAAKANPALPISVLYATLLGAAIRLSMPLHASAPLNDGGLFYSMIVDLQQNHFLLPDFTSYNAAHIPFAYPPLAFYLTALLSSGLNLSVFDLLRLLPAVISALTIPAFYMLARQVLRSEAQVALAVVLFAFIPRTLDWPIMVGGITRSLGLLFALLAMHQFYLLFPAGTNRSLLLAIFFGSLVVYTHPEAAVHAVISAVVFFLVKDRSLHGLLRGLLVVLGVALLTSPWWLTVTLRHGVTTLLAPLAVAGADSPGLLGRIFTLFISRFTDENYLSMVGVLGWIGAAALVVRRQFLMPVWMAAHFLIEPRGGTLFLLIPFTMMAAIAVEAVIIPALRRLQPQPEEASAAPPETEDPSLRRLLDGRPVRILLVYLLLYSMASAMSIVLMVNQKYTLRAADLDAFQWVKDNTIPGANFALITGENALRDASSEWFPAIAGRRSLGTIFGYEWVNDGRFMERRAAYNALQACSNRDAACLDAWSRQADQAIDYVYIRKFVEDIPVEPALAGYLLLSSQYEQVYESEAVVIFQHVSNAP